MSKTTNKASLETWIRNEELVRRSFAAVLGEVPGDGITSSCTRSARVTSGKIPRLIAGWVKTTALLVTGSAARKCLEEDLKREIRRRLAFQADQESKIFYAQEKIEYALYKEIRRQASRVAARVREADLLARAALRAKVHERQLEARLKQVIETAQARLKRAAARGVELQTRRASILAGLWR